MEKIRTAFFNSYLIAFCVGIPFAQSGNIKIPREVGTTWEYAIHVNAHEAYPVRDTNPDDLSRYWSDHTKDTVFDFNSGISIVRQTESAESTFLEIRIRNLGTGFIRWEVIPHIPEQQHAQTPPVIKATPIIDTVFEETLSFAKSNHNCSALPEGRRKTLLPKYEPPKYEPHLPFSPGTLFFSSYFLESCVKETWQVGAYWKNYYPQHDYDPGDSNNYEIWRDSTGLLFKTFDFSTVDPIYTGAMRQNGFVELKRFKGVNFDTSEWKTANALIESTPKNYVKSDSACEGGYYKSNFAFQATPPYSKPEVSISPLPAGLSFHPGYQPFYQFSGVIAFGAPDWTHQFYSKYPLRTDTTTIHVNLLRNPSRKLIFDSASTEMPYVFKYSRTNPQCAYNPIYAYDSLPPWLHPVRKFSRTDTLNLDINGLPAYEYWERPFSVSGTPPEKKDFRFLSIACLDSAWIKPYWDGGTVPSTYVCEIQDTSVVVVKMTEGSAIRAETSRFNRIALVGGPSGFRLQSMVAGEVLVAFRDMKGRILDWRKYQVIPGENTLSYPHRLPEGLIILSAIWPDGGSRDSKIIR